MHFSAPEIRKAASGDIDQIVALVEQYWALEGIPGFERESLSALLGKLANDQKLGCILVATTGAEAVCYLIVVFVFSLEHMGLTAEIDEFFVLNEFRTKGFGSALIEAAEKCAIDAGCANLSLQISLGNARAREFYTRYGFNERSGYQLLDKALPHA